MLDPAEVWPRAKKLAGPRLRSMLDVMSVREVSDRLLTLAVPEPRAAMVRDHMPEIVRLVQKVGAGSMSLSIVEIKPAAMAEEKEKGKSTPAEHVSVDLQGEADHPLVKEAQRVFGAKVVHIEPRR